MSKVLTKQVGNKISRGFLQIEKYNCTFQIKLVKNREFSCRHQIILCLKCGLKSNSAAGKT